MVVATTDKRGMKRICMNCSTRFYDFNKRPIICPHCETEFTGEIKVKARRARVANDEEDDVIIAKLPDDDLEADIVADVPDAEEVVDDETVSLEEVNDGDDDVDEDDETLDADLDLDDDEDDDDDDDVIEEEEEAP